MADTKKLYHITFSSPQFRTLGDFLEDKSSVVNIYFSRPDYFLSIVGEDGLTNRQRIETSYKTSEEKIYIGASAYDLLLKVGTVLYLEYDSVQVAFATEGIEVVSNDAVAFKAQKLAELEADKGYISVNPVVQGQGFNGQSQEMYPEVTVWIWCRALSPKEDESRELTGQFFDLTPFVQRVQTNVGKNGGNFEIILPPLVCELKDKQWVLSKNISSYINDNETSLQGDGYVAESELLKFKNDELIKNQFFFHNIINSNDLIFIRFETLNMEKRQRYLDSQPYYVNKNNIANRIYDMIGLVDNNIKSENYLGNDVTISITGRDLSKLFIEDGTYFYALENSQGLLKFAGQSEQKNSLINRIFADGAYNFIGLYLFNSIENILKFIIQQLSNIKIVPDDLFISYAKSKRNVNGVEVEYDARNKQFNDLYDKNKVFTDNNIELNKTDFKRRFKEQLARGIWQIVKLVIDESVANRYIVDSSFSTANGSLLNFIQSVAQEPLVEFYMDTYKDQYHLIVRKPPYDQKALISLIEGKVSIEDATVDIPPAIIDIEQKDVLSENLSFNDSQIYSWYHFYPKNNFFGDANDYTLAYLGALYFPEYAEIWGSKPFQQSHPYMPYVPRNNEKRQYSLYVEQSINDLKYVVESSQYLPFTRKGILVLNGDRRLKIGNVIRYKPTGEIFFIDNVQQTFQITDQNIERTTTINVSRGMIEQLIYGTHLRADDGSNDRVFVSYFNIIDTRLDIKFKEYEVDVPKQRRVKKKVKVYTNTLQLNNQNLSTGGTPFLINSGFDFYANTDQIIRKDNVGINLLEKYNRHPQNKRLFIKFINEINKLGYRVILIPGATNRSYAEQALLKKQNDNNARPGHSRHESGRAIDITVVNYKTGETLSKQSSEFDWRKTGIPALAISIGLQWGDTKQNGTFTNKNGYVYIDRVHFQIVENQSAETKEIEQEVTEEYIVKEKQTGLDLDSVFSNFKVNKYTFNFFIKRLQFDEQFRTVKSRTIYNSDQKGSPLKNDVVVVAKKKRR
jgi:hypothetical protein